MPKVFTSIDGNERKCPKCGAELNPTTYYLAQSASVITSVRHETLQRVKTTTTTYKDISKKNGGICVACGLKKYKTTRGRGLILLATGLGLLIITLTISIVYSEWLRHIQRILREAFYFICVSSLFVFVIGVILAIYGSKYSRFKKHSKHSTIEDALSYLFVKNVDPTKLPARSVALSTAQYEQLTIK